MSKILQSLPLTIVAGIVLTVVMVFATHLINTGYDTGTGSVYESQNK